MALLGLQFKKNYKSFHLLTKSTKDIHLSQSAKYVEI